MHLQNSSSRTPFPLTQGKKWKYQSEYTLTVDGTLYEGKISETDEVTGFENVMAINEETYFCAVVAYREKKQLMIDGSNMTFITTGRYWISSDAGTVKQQLMTDCYVDEKYTQRRTRMLLLKSIQKP